jgi:hypothetical protein
MKNKLLPLFLVLGSLSAYSQVGIGTNNPDPSAQLHVKATNRGVLIPNVALLSTTDVVTIKSPAESLLVFNTAKVLDVTPGYYFWLNNKWNRIALASELSGLSGLDGKNGKDGLAGAAGVPGAPGTAPIDANTVMYIDNTTGVIYVRDTTDPAKWVPINGKDGKDGINGAPGLAGGIGVPGVGGVTPADGITTWIDSSTGTIYVQDPITKEWKEVTGLNGLDGKNGKDGLAGAAGVPGAKIIREHF